MEREAAMAAVAADAVACAQHQWHGLEEVLAAQHALLSANYDAWCMVGDDGSILEAADLSYLFTSRSMPSASLAGQKLQDIVPAGFERGRVERCLAEARATDMVTKIQTCFDLAHTTPVADDEVVSPSVMDAELSCKAVPCVGTSPGAAQLAARGGAPWARGGLFVGVNVQAKQQRQQQQQQQQQEATSQQIQPQLAASPTAPALHEDAQLPHEEAQRLFDELSVLDGSQVDFEPDDGETDTLSEHSQATRVGRTYSLTSAARNLPRLPIKEVARDVFVQEAARAVHPAIRGTVRRMVEVAQGASGGCSLAVAAAESWEELRDGGLADYQIVDRGEAPEDGQTAAKWQRGYMNARIKGINCRDQAFSEAVWEFSAHTEKDRWPAGHEADGLPKDGFAALLGTEGDCLKSAVRLAGLPVPPFRWDRVGTRHYSALSLAWQLRHTPSAVVVRSDSGSIHCISFDMTTASVLKTHIVA